MHILNSDVLGSILFSRCKSKLTNIINTENSSYTYNLRTRADFSQNRQKTDRPTSQGNVLCGASKKLRGWCCWSCEENKSHEYQHNIKTLVRDWWLLLPDGKGVKFTRFPHKALWHSSLAVKWQFIFFSPLYTVFATTDPLSVPIANIVIPPNNTPLLPQAIEGRGGGGVGVPGP